MPSTEKSAQRPDLTRPDRFLWEITHHVCRVCFGRVLMRETFDRRRVYRCSCCGVEQEGKSEASICCCGMKLKTGVDAGVRCVVSEHQSPELPSEIVAQQIELPPIK